MHGAFPDDPYHHEEHEPEVHAAAIRWAAP
jgi:hypothetical protein